MSFFFKDDEERFTTGLRKSGFPRYREVLEGSWKDFMIIGFVTLLFYFPILAGLVLAIGTRSSLVALLAGIVGGAILGPGYSCMVDLILRRLRDDLADRGVCWRRAMRQNWRAAILPGIIQGVLLSMIVFSAALILWGKAPVTIANLLLLVLAALVGIMLLSIWWPQVVLFEQKASLQLKNAAFFCIFSFGKVLLASLLQLAWWAVMFLFLPWTAFLVPAIGLWYVLFLSLHLLYPTLDESFRIEEQIEEKLRERGGA